MVGEREITGKAVAEGKEINSKCKNLIDKYFEDKKAKEMTQKSETAERAEKTEQAEEYAKSYFKNMKFTDEILNYRKDAIARLVDELLNKEYNEIITAHEKHELPILFNEVDWENLREANYDLRLGEDVYVTTKKLPEKLSAMGADGTISIEPGEFGILMTYESIFVPHDLMGLISIRLRYKNRGLVNISGFHVNPGFWGKIMFAVYNAGPSDVVLRYKEPVFMIMFDRLSSPSREIKPSIFRKMENIPVRIISALRGTSVSVRNLDERVKRIETILPILITILVGLISVLLAWVLTRGGGS